MSSAPNAPSNIESHLPPTPHQQHITMLSMLYPTIPLGAISAIYHSNENKDLGERMRQTRDVLEQIQTRNYFREGEEKVTEEASHANLEEQRADELKEQEKITEEIKELTDEERKQIEATGSWFTSIFQKFSFWNGVAKDVEQGDGSEPPTTSWWNVIKEKFVRGPLPPIHVTNHSDKNIAFTTLGPLDIHVPIKTIADVIRMIQNGTLKLAKVDAKGGEGVLKERLGPGVVVCFAATKADTTNVFTGEGWFHVGFKLTMGFSESKYEYPRDFTVQKLPLHLLATIPGIGPYYYAMVKYLISHD